MYFFNAYIYLEKLDNGQYVHENHCLWEAQESICFMLKNW